MRLIRVGLLLLLFVQAGGSPVLHAQTPAFPGRWEVTSVTDTDPEGFPWSGEVKYPKSMVLEASGTGMAGRYTDQYGYEASFALAAVVNAGRNLILVHGGAGTKDPTALSPVHQVVMREGRLHAVVVTDRKLFEWTAERK